jgi:hypothetical protein
MAKKITRLIPFVKGPDAYQASFRIIGISDEFSEVFQSSIGCFSDFVLSSDSRRRNANPAQKTRFDRYRKLKTDGLLCFTQQDEDGIFSVDYLETVSVQDIIEFFQEAGVIIEEVDG